MNKKYISLRNKEISRDREIEQERKLNEQIDAFIKRGTSIATEINICRINLINENYDTALKYLSAVMNKFDKAYEETYELKNLLEASKDYISIATDEIEGQMSITDYPEVAQA